MKYELKAELKMKATKDLEKSVAADLLIPDPCATHIIPSGEQKVNENPQKYDRGAGDNNNIKDLFAPCK